MLPLGVNAPSFGPLPTRSGGRILPTAREEGQTGVAQFAQEFPAEEEVFF
jgi:hypothetical protein